MQTKMFVFIGVTNSEPAPTINELLDRLQFRFSSTDISIQFTQKDKLLTSRYSGVSYYVSVLNSKIGCKWLRILNSPQTQRV